MYGYITTGSSLAKSKLDSFIFESYVTDGIPYFEYGNKDSIDEYNVNILYIL